MSLLRISFSVLLIQALFTLPARADFRSCEKYIEKMVLQSPRSESQRSRLARIEAASASGSLLDTQSEKSIPEIEAHNAKIKKALRDPLPGSFRGMEQSVNYEMADSLVKLITWHPVNGVREEKKYDPEDCYGFCFGRAVLIHNEALRRNVDPEAIKKIWAVGSLENEKWHFHVATILKAKGSGTWWATDPIYRSAINVETWIRRMERSADDDRLMFFVTDPRRFSVYDPRFYTGLDLLGNGRSDYYNGYFRDYFEFFLHAK